MQFDKNAMFADEQAITGTTVSESLIITAGDIAGGTPVPFATVVTEAFNNLTKLNIAIQTCANNTFASDTFTTIYSEDFAAADLVKNAIIGTRFFPKGAKNFCRAKYTVTGSNPTTGKLKQGVVTAIPEGFEDK